MIRTQVFAGKVVGAPLLLVPMVVEMAYSYSREEIVEVVDR